MSGLRELRAEFGPLTRLAGPLALAEIGWMAMGIVDTMMVGRLPESAVAIGAVSLGSVLFVAVGLFGAGLLLGLDTVVSQAFGAGQLEDCHRYLFHSLYISLPLAGVLMTALWLTGPLLALGGVNPAVLRETLPYLNAVNWGLFPLLLYFAFRRYLQAMNLVWPVMVALFTANGVNAVANWVFVFGHFGAPALGVEGAGWATFISRTYLAVYLLVAILYYDRRLRTGLWRATLAPELARVRRLLSLGFPAALQLGFEIVVFAVVTALVARLDAASLAAHQIALNAASATFMVPLGISSAAAVRVGQALGRRQPDDAARAGWASLLLGAGFMACAAATFLLLPRPIARIFTADAVVIQTSVALLAVAAFFQLFDGLQVVATGALRGAGDTRTPMVFNLLFHWLVGLPLGIYLGFGLHWGAVGLWIGLSAGLTLLGIVLLTAWRLKVRRLAHLVAAAAD